MNLFLKKIRGDKVIWSIVILLAFFSFLPVYSASSNFGNSFVLSNVFKHFAIITLIKLQFKQEKKLFYLLLQFNNML